VFKDYSKSGIPEWVLQVVIPKDRRFKNVSTIYPGDIRNLLTLNYHSNYFEMMLVLDSFKCLYFRSKYIENWIDSYLNNGYRMMEFGKESKEYKIVGVGYDNSNRKEIDLQKMTDEEFDEMHATGVWLMEEIVPKEKPNELNAKRTLKVLIFDRMNVKKGTRSFRKPTREFIYCYIDNTANEEGKIVSKRFTAHYYNKNLNCLLIFGIQTIRKKLGVAPESYRLVMHYIVITENCPEVLRPTAKYDWPITNIHEQGFDEFNSADYQVGSFEQIRR
jgi:hypothetical protein